MIIINNIMSLRNNILELILSITIRIVRWNSRNFFFSLFSRFTYLFYVRLFNTLLWTYAHRKLDSAKRENQNHIIARRDAPGGADDVHIMLSRFYSASVYCIIEKKRRSEIFIRENFYAFLAKSNKRREYNNTRFRRFILERARVRFGNYPRTRAKQYDAGRRSLTKVKRSTKRVVFRFWTIREPLLTIGVIVIYYVEFYFYNIVIIFDINHK